MEQDAVWYVLQHVAALEDWSGKKDGETRSLAHRRSDKSRELPFDVKAAFTRSVAPGYIFVEANLVNDVELVCQGFIGFQGCFRNITIVSMEDSAAYSSSNHLIYSCTLTVGYGCDVASTRVILGTCMIWRWAVLQQNAPT